MSKIVKEQEHLFMIYNLTMPMFDLWNDKVIDPYLELYGDLVKILPFEKIEKEVHSLIISNCTQMTPPIHRYMAARMIGFVA